MGKYDKMSDRELAVAFACDTVAGYSMCNEYLNDPDFDIRRVAHAIIEMDRELETPEGWVYEDDLPAMSYHKYREWFDSSKLIQGVRMGPPVV